LEGTVSLRVQDVEVPLSGNILKTGKGSGRMDLADLRLMPTGELAKLFRFMNLGQDKPYPITVSGLDFRFKNGALEYDNLTMVFEGLYDVRFRGAVHFDDSVDLIMSLPVMPNLLESLGVKGPVGKFAEVLTGSRIEVPLSGKRWAPHMDLGKVDPTPLVTEAIKKLGKDLFPKGLPTLPKGFPELPKDLFPKGLPHIPGLDPSPSPSPGPPTTAPTSAPVKPPEKKGILDLLK